MSGKADCCDRCGHRLTLIALDGSLLCQSCRRTVLLRREKER